MLYNVLARCYRLGCGPTFGQIRIGFLLGVVLVSLTGCNVSPGGGRLLSSDELPDPQWPVGPFALIERSGKTVTDQDLRGHVWVASFIFTRCTGPCPSVASTVARLQHELQDLPQVRFVTFTVDPRRDDLRTLNEYAQARGADPQRWLFLTGDEDTIHRIIREQFKQAVGRNEGPHVAPGDEFLHTTRLVLVDAQGRIRGWCSGLPDERFPDRFEKELARFVERLRSLAAEAAH
ncbi:MAG: SCO family protein [Gemmataceae bacterium]|nr:SCO family protein [Gemmataceae bacterium]MDW8243101.1 SCO family protein [Thermogemmata sp.]